MSVVIIFLVTLIGQASHVTAGAGSCDDIDTISCKQMMSRNANMCSDPALSKSVCPRLCNNCPLTCYNCDRNSSDVTNCNTITCSLGEMCMLWRKVGADASHNEFKLRCGPQSICSMMVRRDVDNGHAMTKHQPKQQHHNKQQRDAISINCCDSDLCNAPTPLTTTTTTTTTTTHAPSTAIQRSTTIRPSTTVKSAPIKASPSPQSKSCKRDVIFMIGNACEASSFSHVKSFVAHVINGLDIDNDHIRVGLASFKHYCKGTTHVELNRGISKWTLLSALSSMTAEHAWGTSNLAAARYYNDNFNVGNRQDVDDVIVILATGGFLADMAMDKPVMELHTHSHNVITISYGHVNNGQMHALATDNNHFRSYNWNRNDDDVIRSWLLNMICS